MIKSLFNSTGLSDSELERQIGLPKGIIYNWDAGRSKSYKNYIDKISVYFNVSSNYLLGIESLDKENTKPTIVMFNSDGVKGQVIHDDKQKLLSKLIYTSESLPNDKIELLISMAQSLAKSNKQD